MSGARSRRKGANAERELAKRFAEAMPGADCKRGIGQARRGSEVADCEVPRFWVESKHGKRPNPRAALAQAIEACEANGNGKTPIAVIRDDRKEPFVCMRLEDFLAFVGEWWQWQQAKEATATATAHFNAEMEQRYPNGAILWSKPHDAESVCAALDERDQGV
jgi:hypothetical protein